MDPSSPNARQMRQYRFLLNVAKAEEQELSEIIRDLKSKRSFSHAIRTGLRLVWSLMQGRTDILVAEFPWVVEQLQNPLVELQAQLDRIETKLAKPLVEETLPSLSRQTPLNLEADERLNLSVSQAKVLENPTFNMLISVASIDATGFIGLDVEVLEYGIKQGKIPAHFLEQKKALQAKRHSAPQALTMILEDTQPTIPIEVPDAKMIAGGNLALAAPDLADIDNLSW